MRLKDNLNGLKSDDKSTDILGDESVGWTDGELEVFRQALHEWMQDFGIDDIPSDDTVNDMEMQDFYDRVEHCDVNVTIDDKEATKQLISDLYFLQSSQLSHKFEQYPPISDAKERLDCMYQRMAERVDSVLSNYDNMSGIALDDAKANSISSIKHDLTKGAVAVYSYQIMDKVQSVKDAEFDKDFDGDSIGLLNLQTTVEPEDLPFSKIVDMRIQTNTQLTQHDINLINTKIVDEYERICGEYELGMIRAVTEYSLADKSEALRREYHLDMDDTVLPAYIEDEIGSNLSPDQIRQNASQLEFDVHSDYKRDLLNLYEDVYALQSFKFDNVSADVVGGFGRSANKRPVLITLDTLNELGDEYETFRRDKFEEALQGFKERHGSKSLMGIDVRKNIVENVAPKQPEVQETLETTKESEQTVIEHDKSNVLSQRRLPDVSHIEEKEEEINRKITTGGNYGED